MVRRLAFTRIKKIDRKRRRGSYRDHLDNSRGGHMTLKRNLLTLAVASVLVGGMHSARAADAPAPDQATATPGADDTPKKNEDNAAELGTVTVTGVRASIERAISVKQNSNSIVEAISAEDGRSVITSDSAIHALLIDWSLGDDKNHARAAG